MIEQIQKPPRKKICPQVGARARRISSPDSLKRMRFIVYKSTFSRQQRRVIQLRSYAASNNLIYVSLGYLVRV